MRVTHRCHRVTSKSNEYSSLISNTLLIITIIKLLLIMIISLYQSYMAVIPSVIVHKCCSICHTSNLISVVPPRHDPERRTVPSYTKWKTFKSVIVIFGPFSPLRGKYASLECQVP